MAKYHEQLKEQLKQFLQQPYDGADAFLENVIFPVFGHDNFENSGNLNVLAKRPDLRPKAEASGIRDIRNIGELYVEGSQLDIFDITLDFKKQLQRNRVEIQRIIFEIISSHSGAFIIFHYDSRARWEWRFTFLNKGANAKERTDAKRYTFLLGPGQSCRTAAENFVKIFEKIDKEGEFEMDDIVRAFDVEALSKEFFEKYKVRYGRFVGHVIGKEYVDKGDGKGEWKEKEGLTPSALFYGLHEDEKVVRDYVKKLLGRIVFLHFLQKKGWLGATDEEWTNGPQDFMRLLFDHASADQKENFLDGILEPLFSCLDTPLSQRDEVFDTMVEGLRSVRVPFLGGLFERDEQDKADSVFPIELFADLFKFLSEYNFTIDENDPNDAQVGVDPEMLGRIFENLLEDNKDKGAFYTPKEIVQYMCRESLIAYLQTNVTDESTRENLRLFVTTHDVSVLGGRDSVLAQNVSQCLKDVKICDPAIGSGAFPMGLLNELFLCRGVIEDFYNAADIKRHIIQQNIYGVDIENGAVEIARLRFWLSLITDADKPDALPNLDFKIMQGNSLLEQYRIDDAHTITLDDIIEENRKLVEHAKEKSPLFEGLDVVADLKKTLHDYYTISDHEEKHKTKSEIEECVRRYIDIKINKTYSKPSQVAKKIAALDKLSETKLINNDFFLWHTWFADVFEEGGFDIVIGNPPYGAKLSNEDKKAIKVSYESAKTIQGKQKGSLDTFSLFIERGYVMSKTCGITYMIVPLSITASDAMSGIHNLLLDNCDTIRVSSYGDRPKRIFESAEQQVSIISFRKTGTPCKQILTTSINKRYSDESLWVLLDNLRFTNSLGHIRNGRIPKLGNPIETNILSTLAKSDCELGNLYVNGGSPIYYRKAGGRYYKLITTEPTYSSAEGSIEVDHTYRDAIAACMSTSLYYWFWLIHSDWHNMRSSELSMFPIPKKKFTPSVIEKLRELYSEYLKDLYRNSKTMKSGLVCYYARKSKTIIDKIDRYVGKLYGLSDEEIEFIINYDIIYRNNDE